jgi:hypothetical protein
VGEIEMAGDWIRFVCAFCDQPTNEDPQYVHITLSARCAIGSGSPSCQPPTRGVEGETDIRPNVCIASGPAATALG